MLLDIRRMFSRYDGPVHCEETVSMEGEDFPGYTIEGPVHAAFCATLARRCAAAGMQPARHGAL